MRIETARTRRRPLALTSLIDVIFLLLLFFMLTSTFSRHAEIPLTGGRAGTSSAGAPDILIVPQADGPWRINGQTLSPADIGPEIARLSRVGARSALILMPEGSATQDLVDALETVRRAAPVPLSVAY
ncbi:ExbD/TolR family protein [Pelagibacterium montanilacus]|uniref:ExbD/TolR family protein n=1 Tax=Pelagibacterium montanilacus TaxID=2185280 RepID=UPI000F8E1611|nr:biopolymer transporter ExbD [Pelagibacterium montanilacus]